MKMNICMSSSFLFIIIMMVLSGLPFPHTSENAEAQQVTPDVNVIVNPSILYVDVSPVGTGIGQATITLENEGPHHVSCTIDVEIEGYLASPNHVTVSLAPMATRNLPMAIVAQLRSQYQIQGGLVTCTVKSVDFIPLDNYFVNNAGFSVQTLPYARLILDAEEPLMKVWPGKTTKIKFDVLNEGNIDDGIRLDVTNRDELFKEGFSIALESSGSVIVLPKDSIRMSVHITTPKKLWVDNYYTVDVRAVSDFDTNMRFDYSVTIWVRGVYIPAVELLIPALIILFVMWAYLGKRKER